MVVVELVVGNEPEKDKRVNEKYGRKRPDLEVRRSGWG